MTLETTLKHTPLFESYAKYGGKTIDFGGWNLPVQFSSIKEEHEAVRTKAGLFDVSHMGEIFVEGSESLAYLQNLMTNDVSKITIDGTQYTTMCYENGGVVDDLLIYRLAENNYLLVVNAANIEKDYEWLLKHESGDVKITNQSDEIGQLALQGPLAEEVLQQLTDVDLSTIKPFHLKQHVEVAGFDTLVSRTGYTGEDGFEIYGANDAIVALWDKILEAGKEKGVLPCGLGSRDTLRFEACLPLYGQELSNTISPLETGINFVVKINKESDFIGKTVLADQKANGVPRKLVGIEMIDKGIPRHGYKVFVGDLEVGEVTTGTQQPLTKRNIGLALIKSEYAELDQEVEVEIRNKRVKAKTVATPFYKRLKK
ncbi:glycine cleavage system aminomethyltransferase GcvT [Rummeliibacillus stabekisii]|uniref:glycine cleavage system aminomethyltransferase GcvT n=1 Tax=Rummeliibacillus stabekisii TaxID=241244 RepID=UPI00203FE933|nr:glycine cleavage system aminomethyltransferase GcvT [Rummeliibacillus stabekisii]MCM3316232.1 glycine cleavage system aminomethyltransferase GcvT [Rummeliibacillus stabekisii]